MDTIKTVMLLLLSCSISICYSQQEQQISQYMLSKYRINPAYGGLDYSLSIDALLRTQWTGLPGQPKTQYLSANIPAYAYGGAVGVTFERYTEGALSFLQATGSYNYVHNLSFGFLSGGVRLGSVQSSLDGNSLKTSSGDYSISNINHNDPALSIGTERSFAPVVEVGAYLYMQNAQVGISVSRLPSFKNSLGNGGLQQVTHVDLYGEITWSQSDQIEFLQSILLKTDFNTIQSDVSTLAVINGSIFGGIGIRGYHSTSIDAISFIAGVKLGDNYRLTYSYDAGLSEIKRVNEGTHEIVLNYNLRKLVGIKAAPKVEYNPRFL